MNKVSPYITRDVQLNLEWAQDEFPRIDEAGYYCVYWWKDIALGHLFVERNQQLASEELHHKIFDVVSVAIDFYIHRQNIEKPDYISAFFDHNRQRFNSIMANIFAAFYPSTLPARVDISVVICTRNRSVSLKNCLDQLGQLSCLPNEIIVVDNAPVDESTRLVASQYPGVVYFLEPRPGLDIARNSGAKLAKSSIVAYVDDDVLVHPMWAYRTWEAFSITGISAITGLVIAKTLATEAQQIFEKFWSFNRGYEDKIFDNNFFTTNLVDGPPVWEIGAGANMAFRKSIFEKVGYFDPRLDVGAAGCSGDSEIWFRILANGGTILYTPRPVVYHEHRENLSQLKKQLFFYMRGFAAAALIQQQQYKTAGYKNRLFKQLPRSYIQMLINAFPRYAFQNRTLLSEIRGVISGVRFFNKNKSKSSQ